MIFDGMKDKGIIQYLSSEEIEREKMEKGTGKKKKIMVAIEESEFSHYALKWTLENLLELIQDSKLVIFTAQPLPDYTYLNASTFGNTPVELITSILEKHKRMAEVLLEKAKHICSKYGVDADTVTEVGNSKEVILNAVEKLNIQLLVVGSRGRGAIQRAFLGSVSSFCVHNAKCPVLVVRKTD